MSEQVGRTQQQPEPVEPYEAPRVLEDCPLETMSLACTKNFPGCRTQGGPPSRQSS